jgi:hypothetical protein
MSRAELPDDYLRPSRLQTSVLSARLLIQWINSLDRAMDKWSGLLLFFRLYLTLKCESPL